MPLLLTEEDVRQVVGWHDMPDLIARGAVAEAAFLDLYAVITEPALGRPGPDAITLFLSQGVGLWDAALGGWVYARAVARGLGQEISLTGRPS